MTATVNWVAGWAIGWLACASVASGLALACGRWLVRDPRRRDWIWKAALVIPLVISLAVAFRPGGSDRAVDVTALGVRLGLLPPVETRVQVTASGRADRVSVTTSRVERPSPSGVAWLLVLVVVGPGAVAMIRLGARRARFFGGLRDRSALDPAAYGVRRRRLRLRGGRSACLSASPAVETAAALGGAEVCISIEALRRLTPEERDGVIAHEVAHLRRRDPLWVMVADVVAAALIVQPLVAAMGRRYRRDAELICDASAVREVGNPLAYLRVLARFAELLDTPEPSSPRFGAGRSQLVGRGERVLSGLGPKAGLLLASVGLMVVCVTPLAVPAFTTGATPGPIVTETRVVGAGSPTRVEVVARPAGQVREARGPE